MAISQIPAPSTASPVVGYPGTTQFASGMANLGYYSYTTTSDDIGRVFLATVSPYSQSSTVYSAPIFGSYGTSVDKINIGDNLVASVGYPNNGNAASRNMIEVTASGQPIGIYNKWKQSTLTGSTGTARTVYYLNGIYIIGGSTSSIWTSTDGITWTYRANLGLASPIVGFAHNGSNLYMALGANGNTATSPDGITWTLKTIPATASGGALAYGAGLWVLLTQGATSTTTIYTSADNGTTWVARTITGGNSVVQNDLIYANGTFKFIGGNNATSFKLHSSTDGITWTNTNTDFGGFNASATSALNRIIYANGYWVIVAYGLQNNSSNYAYSTNGTTWTGKSLYAIPVSLDQIAYANSMWWIIDSNGHLWSNTDITNISTWISRGSAINYSTYRSLATNGTHMVTVYGSLQTYYSIDGLQGQPLKVSLFASPAQGVLN